MSGLNIFQTNLRQIKKGDKMGLSGMNISNLKDGDICLYNGNGWISKMIRLVDGTVMNHASIYVGNNSVIEAEGGKNRISKNTIEESISGSNWIKVYRLIERPDNMDPVVDKANWYFGQGNRYGYEQILLLAMLALIRKPKKGKIFKYLVKIVFERAAAVLLKLTEGGKEVLICSELVYRSYNEAHKGINDPYSLKLTNLNTIKGMVRLPENVHEESFYALFSVPAAKNLSDNKSIDMEYNKVKLMADDMELDVLSDMDDELKQLIPLMENDELTTKGVPEVSIEELEGAFQVFASQLHRQANLSQLDQAESINSATYFREKSMTFKSLNEVIADFVTPGDLYKADTLKYVGKIKS